MLLLYSNLTKKFIIRRFTYNLLMILYEFICFRATLYDVWWCMCETGDLFILVYSIDNRESFQEVKRLQEQIFETKASSSTTAAASGWPGRRRKPYVPMVVVGNKCELSRGATGTVRDVETWELLKLADGKPSCGCLEASAKRNINVEETFLKLFMLARLPTEMTPSLHRKVCGSCSLDTRKMSQVGLQGSVRLYYVVAPWTLMSNKWSRSHNRQWCQRMWYLCNKNIANRWSKLNCVECTKVKKISLSTKVMTPLQLQPQNLTELNYERWSCGPHIVGLSWLRTRTVCGRAILIIILASNAGGPFMQRDHPSCRVYTV